MLTLRDVSKRYNNKYILNNISLELREGEVVGLIGPNGVGKTTLLNLIANIESADSGEIIKMSDNIVFMQESNVLYKDLTGLQHLKFIARLNRKTSADIHKVINELNMNNFISTKVRNYSLGMKQHLIFACGLICEPSVFLLDEPLNGLDPDSVSKFRDIIKKLKDNGTSIFFSSHMLSEVDLISDRTFFLKDGIIKKIITNKSQQDNKVYKIYLSEYNKDLINYIKNQGIEILKCTTEKIVVVVSEDQFNLVLKKLLDSGIRIKSVNQENTLLEKYYKEVYGDNYE